MAAHKELSFLIIDDDLKAVENIRSILSAHQCRVAHSPSDALELYQTSRPDVTLLEISSPSLGLQTLQKIKGLDAKAFIVIVTTSRSDKDVQDSMKQGAAGYILKPFLAHHIVECIDEYQFYRNIRTREIENETIEN